MVTGDFDGDGRTDDLAGVADNGTLWYTTNLSSWTQIPGRLSLLVTGDFDGDGRTDDLAGVADNDTIWYTTNLVNWQNVPGYLTSLVVGDFDGKMSQEPMIEFTYVPPLGSYERLQGQVWYVNPADYKVVVYIYVLDNWWVKPSFAEPLTTIQANGSWSTDIVTGGVDELATQIAAFLIPNGYNPPTMPTPTLPTQLEQDAIAKVKVTRAP